ncbi:hypothetical protein CEV33_0309 [Brucella grignonensis]|uniref:Uncharacterized protein n=1 Tax=Brucella grignonensis TaxID=94627 RepID=A0A256FF73_9HYPH|nr:hypothetical protein CEV33_0309 [Brucella grignonensis]
MKTQVNKLSNFRAAICFDRAISHLGNLRINDEGTKPVVIFNTE